HVARDVVAARAAGHVRRGVVRRYCGWCSRGAAACGHRRVAADHRAFAYSARSRCSRRRRAGRERARLDVRRSRYPRQRPIELHHDLHGRGARAGGLAHARMREYIQLARPFTLIAPALGFFSGSVTAIGAVPAEPWTWAVWTPALIGALMAAVLNAASNALNQIYDLEIDRVNKPARPLPSGRLSIRSAWTFTWITYAIALALAWFVAPGGRHECFWIVLIATILTFAYSVPPIRTKRHGIWANITIAIPRGVLLKVAGWSAVKTVVGV